MFDPYDNKNDSVIGLHISQDSNQAGGQNSISSEARQVKGSMDQIKSKNRYNISKRQSLQEDANESVLSVKVKSPRIQQQQQQRVKRMVVSKSKLNEQSNREKHQSQEKKLARPISHIKLNDIKEQEYSHVYSRRRAAGSVIQSRAQE